MMSRREATQKFKGKELISNLKERVEVVRKAGLARKVAQLTPLAVVKGE